MSIGPRARRVFAICALALVIGTVVTTAVRAIRTDREHVAATGPAATVRDFLSDSVVGTGGYENGCRYLTPSEQKRVALRGASPHSCSEALDHAQLRIGDKTYTTTRQIYDDLGAGAFRPGNHAVVKIWHGGRSHEFVLVPATAAERGDYAAPPTPWRIAGGAASLVPRLRG